jgi:hypothetical protein
MDLLRLELGGSFLLVGWGEWWPMVVFSTGESAKRLFRQCHWCVENKVANAADGPRILMLESGDWGGIHQYAHALGNGLSGCGVELALLTTEEYELEDRPCGFKRIRVLRREGYGRTLSRVWRVLRDFKPDILHVQSFIAPRKDLVLLFLCRVLGIKVVLTVHNILPHEVRSFERLLYCLYYRLAQGLILHSDLNSRRLREMVSDLQDAYLHVVPHGNYDHLRHLEMGREEAR